MTNWIEISVSPETTLHSAIQKMDNSGIQFIIVLDEEGQLKGVLTDGDIRRAILREVSFSSSVKTVMNTKPITAPAMTSKNDLLQLMRVHSLHHIPLLNGLNQVVSLATIDDLLGIKEKPNWVILMVGGLGSRLRPLTDYCPKPMLKIGEQPILEQIIESFISQGFRRFYLSVNYLGDVIKNYFGDGRRFGSEIRYLREPKALGTAGALSLIPSEVCIEPMIIMNGDVLTTVNFTQMLNFHVHQRAAATMAVREYDFQVPYGVVRMNGINISKIDEKPKQKFFINAGIYILSPHCIRYVPKDQKYDMPTLFEKLNRQGEISIAYALREKWIDIGRLEELEIAKEDWKSRVEIMV